MQVNRLLILMIILKAKEEPWWNKIEVQKQECYNLLTFKLLY